MTSRDEEQRQIEKDSEAARRRLESPVWRGRKDLFEVSAHGKFSDAVSMPE